MELSTDTEILNWTRACTVTAMFLLVFLGSLTSTKETWNRIVTVTAVLAVLLLFVSVGKTMVDKKLLPECPHCEKAVSSAYCPDCGWDSGMDTEYGCPTCGAEWDTTFCGDCGSSMNKEN